MANAAASTVVGVAGSVTTGDAVATVAETVTVNCCENVLTPPLAVPPLSVTVTVMTAVPEGAG